MHPKAGNNRVPNCLCNQKRSGFLGGPYERLTLEYHY